MRIFLAVFPSPEAQRSAFAAIERWKRPNDGVSWVKRDNLHYTLRFLGELDEDGVTRASEAAREVAAGVPVFDARLGAPGAFPSLSRARVLWLGLTHGAKALNLLAERLEQALVAHGFEPAGRPFSPHLTIGRVRDGEADWSARLATLLDDEPTFTIDRLRVVQSTLARGGSIYAMRAEAPLAAAGA